MSADDDRPEYQTCAYLGHGFCPVSDDGFCVGGYVDNEGQRICHG